MHFLWVLLFKWFVFSPNLLHLIPSSAHIKLRTWLGFNSILDLVCAVKMSWISPINASFRFWALDLVFGLLGICKASFELFICAGAWGWLNFSFWFSSLTHHGLSVGGGGYFRTVSLGVGAGEVSYSSHWLFHQMDRGPADCHYNCPSGTEFHVETSHMPTWVATQCSTCHGR